MEQELEQLKAEFARYLSGELSPNETRIMYLWYRINGLQANLNVG
jgi:hypothetical protein